MIFNQSRRDRRDSLKKVGIKVSLACKACRDAYIEGDECNSLILLTTQPTLYHTLRKGLLTTLTTMSETLHQWDYLFAFGVIFCALDAYNIGANE